MEDIFHPAQNNFSVFNIYQSKYESFPYSMLAASYEQKFDRRLFHRPDVYTKSKKTLNIENIPFQMKNKNVGHFYEIIPNFILV